MAGRLPGSLQKKGANLALLARGKDGLDAAVREVKEIGGKALAIQVDVADYDELESAADRIENELGAIDVWVNNAMTSVYSPFNEIQPDEHKRVTEVTYLGQVYGTRIALKKMTSRNKGAIVLVGSALGYCNQRIAEPSMASRYFLNRFVRNHTMKIVIYG